MPPGSPGKYTVEFISPAAVDASVAADLAVSVQMEWPSPCGASRSATAGRCRPCPITASTCTWTAGPRAELASRLAAILRQAYGVADSLAAE